MEIDKIKEIINNQIAIFRLKDMDSWIVNKLIEPKEIKLSSDYTDRIFDCWQISVKDSFGNCIVYCEKGFENNAYYKWGFIDITKQSMQSDDHWFADLEDVIINSGLWKGEIPSDYEIK